MPRLALLVVSSLQISSLVCSTCQFQSYTLLYPFGEEGRVRRLRNSLRRAKAERSLSAAEAIAAHAQAWPAAEETAGIDRLRSASETLSARADNALGGEESLERRVEHALALIGTPSAAVPYVEVRAAVVLAALIRRETHNEAGTLTVKRLFRLVRGAAASDERTRRETGSAGDPREIKAEELARIERKERHTMAEAITRAHERVLGTTPRALAVLEHARAGHAPIEAAETTLRTLLCTGLDATERRMFARTAERGEDVRRSLLEDGHAELIAASTADFWRRLEERRPREWSKAFQQSGWHDEYE